jgi:hypothetical protein
MSVAVYGGLGGGNRNLTPTKFQEWKVALYDTGGAVLNDGSPLNPPLDAYTRLSEPGAAAATFLLTTGGAGNVVPTYRVADGRRWLSQEPGVGQMSGQVVRPHGRYCGVPGIADFRDVYGPTTSVLGPSVPKLMAVEFLAWCRKRTALDATTARVTFGFADNTILFPSAEVARIGLLGDGALGYRIGSVNCPIAAAVAVQNANNAADANFFAPPELANPGVVPFHIRIKMIPPTPNSGGLWACWINGRLDPLAVFRNPINFPRGSGAVDAQWTRIEPSILNYGDAAIAVPGLMFTDIRVWVHDDLTLT